MISYYHVLHQRCIMKTGVLGFLSICAAISLPVALLGTSYGARETSAGVTTFSANSREVPVDIDSGELNRLISPAGYPCSLPDLKIKKTAGCAHTTSYPQCKWQVPPESEAGGLYKVWWRTPPGELWGGSRLVKLILSSITLYKKQYPDDEIYVGDIDAPESNHMSHKEGVDADIYLLRWMEWIQVKDARYENNMSWRTEASRKLAREKVLYLAKSFAICSSGRMQIFYNDPKILDPFNEWFVVSGYSSPFGLPMISHNDTHHDHFHVKIPE